MKKVLRTALSLGVSAAALLVCATTASAEAIDFEDGNYSFATVRTDDGGDLSVLSVEEFNGSMQLKVDVQDCSLLPKVVFDMNAIVGTNNLSDVDKILMDITFASKDGTTAPGWFGGCIGSAGANDTPAWNQTDFEGGEYENPVSQPMTIEKKFLLPSQKYVSGTEGSAAQLMRWGTEVPYYMYVDNIRVLDADGNEMPLALSGSSEQTVEAPAEAEAPAETPADAPAEASTETPASDSTTTSSTTGNTAAAAIAVVAACAAAAAVCSRKK